MSASRSRSSRRIQPDGNAPLLRRIQSQLNGYTPAERAIAHHILSHSATLAYETASSLAEKVGVSAITVGRYARTLGYPHFKALKNDLKDSVREISPWLVGHDLERFVDSGNPSGEFDPSLEREFQSLIEVYRIAKTPEWESVVSLLSQSETVFVAGFQTERGIGMLLAHHLQFMRDGVRLVDTTAGNYAEIFASNQPNSCLVVIDIRRYSRQSHLISEYASREGIPLVVLSDTFCDWAAGFTPHVISVPTQTGMFWSSPVALVCAVNLLVNSVIKAIGTDIEPRLQRLSQLHQTFTGYVGHGLSAGKRP